MVYRNRPRHSALEVHLTCNINRGISSFCGLKLNRNIDNRARGTDSDYGRSYCYRTATGNFQLSVAGNFNRVNSKCAIANKFHIVRNTDKDGIFCPRERIIRPIVFIRKRIIAGGSRPNPRTSLLFKTRPNFKAAHLICACGYSVGKTICPFLRSPSIIHRIADTISMTRIIAYAYFISCS